MWIVQVRKGIWIDGMVVGGRGEGTEGVKGKILQFPHHGSMEFHSLPRFYCRATTSDNPGGVCSQDGSGVM